MHPTFHKPKGDKTMRFIILVKATKECEAGIMPSTEILAAMGKFNEELVKAGVMEAGEGLQPSSKGTRISFAGGKKTVTDGPFAETKELVAGFWIWKCKSKEEALQWVMRSPFQEGTVEIRPIFAAEDFGATLTPELREREEKLRAQCAQQAQGAKA